MTKIFKKSALVILTLVLAMLAYPKFSNADFNYYANKITDTTATLHASYFVFCPATSFDSLCTYTLTFLYGTSPSKLDMQASVTIKVKLPDGLKYIFDDNAWEGTIDVSADIVNLSPGTTYYFKLSDDKKSPASFTTLEQQLTFTASPAVANLSTKAAANYPGIAATTFALTPTLHAPLSCTSATGLNTDYPKIAYTASFSNKLYGLLYDNFVQVFVVGTANDRKDCRLDAFITVGFPQGLAVAGSYPISITATYFDGEHTYQAKGSVTLNVVVPTITQSVWKIFSVSDPTTPITSFTCATNCDYTVPSNKLKTGSYQASLTITNSLNQSASTVQNFNVLGPTGVTLGPPPDFCADSTAASIEWTYPGSSTQSAYQVKITRTGNFNNPDFDSGKIQGSSTTYIASNLAFNTTYQAQVTAWDSNDTIAMLAGSNSWKTPTHAYPNVDFSWTPPVNPIRNQLIQFTDATQFSDAGGSGQRGWSWLFGDGGSAAIQNPSHTYTIAGLYNITDNVTDKDGYTCALTKPISIQQPIPVWKEVSPK